MSTLNLKDHMTWPKINSIWSHYNGNSYQVIMFTNIETDRQEEYPTTVVYRNTTNDKCYSRKLIDWNRSMTRISD